ncbi:monothiol bacilliredoxin BrxC family protein [Virgibacillus sp. W0181]|uniref:monothiol bacilliredoxin BrxC family protein n=1 Tax=Virgibacillus sp. W0181 TaxID=3391581 RepID=UPI003F447863
MRANHLKHSTTFPVSTNAIDEYNAYLEDLPNANIYYTLVKVRESRPVSNKIEKDLGVKHEYAAVAEPDSVISGSLSHHIIHIGYS